MNRGVATPNGTCYARQKIFCFVKKLTLSASCSVMMAPCTNPSRGEESSEERNWFADGHAESWKWKDPYIRTAARWSAISKNPTGRDAVSDVQTARYEYLP